MAKKFLVYIFPPLASISHRVLLPLAPRGAPAPPPAAADGRFGVEFDEALVAAPEEGPVPGARGEDEGHPGLHQAEHAGRHGHDKRASQVGVGVGVAAAPVVEAVWIAPKNA